MSGRLELIPASLDLCDAEMRGPAEVGQVLGAHPPASWPPPVFERDDVQRVRRQLEHHPESRAWSLRYVVLRPVAGGPRELVGVAGFAGPPSTRGAVEIGYAIAEEHQRRGYATEAVLALVAEAFEDPSIVTIAAMTYPGLVASIGVLRKTGFVLASETAAGLLRYELHRKS